MTKFPAHAVIEIVKVMKKSEENLCVIYLNMADNRTMQTSLR